MPRFCRSPTAAWLTLITMLALATPTVASGQAGTEPLPPVSVDSYHWVYPLLDRMAADGLLDGVWLPGRRPMDARAIGAALDTAEARAGDDSPWTETARAARVWLTDEYGIRSRTGLRVLPAAGATASDGPRTDPTAARVGARLSYRPLESVGAWADPMLEVGADGVEIPTPRMGAAWRAGAFRLAASYGAHRLGPGASGGIVLHDRQQLGWLEVGLAEPVRLPWLLRYLGPFMISAAGSRFAADSSGPAVGFLTGEFRLQPFPWVTLGMYRSAAVVNEIGGHALGPRDLWLILLGTRSGATANFDDQKASMSASFRARILGVAVNPYFVWGWEDTWEIDEDPGTILGVWLPALPIGGRAVGIRYEYTAFGNAGRIIWPWSNDWAWRDWYRKALRGRRIYTEGDQLLGHPLGGYGTEHRVELDLPLPDRGLLLGSVLFTRDRVEGITTNPGFGDPRPVEYSNLLYDVMPGRSWGGSLSGSYLAGRLRVSGRLTGEFGDEGWSRTVASLGGSWLLR